jgi:hypothetical protein
VVAVALAAVVLGAQGNAMRGGAYEAATITGPCSATIAGRNVASLSTGAGARAISVRRTATVAVTMRASRVMTRLQIFVALGTNRVKIKDRSFAAATSWSEPVAVAPYAAYGAGLYKVSGVGTGPGGFRCTGAALVRIS